MTGQFLRLRTGDRPEFSFWIDGEPARACNGDTLLTAVLLNRRYLRSSDAGDGRRAGFCLMGACQDCWLRLEDGRRLRACTTWLQEGMRVITKDHDR